MAVLNDNKAIVAFKNLLNKSHTDSGKELGNESEGIFFNVPGNAVWLDEIDPTPATAVSQGVAVFVEEVGVGVGVGVSVDVVGVGVGVSEDAKVKSRLSVATWLR